MKKKIAIITSDPDSVNYQIIEKTLFFFEKKLKNKYIFIGSKELFLKKIKKKINVDFVDIPFNEKKKDTYIINCFQAAFNLIKKKKVNTLINLPLNKKEVFKNKYPGVTEYIADNFNCLGKETMLLFNEKFSVSPVTTHIKIRALVKKLTKKKIQNNINNILKFYKKIIKIKKPKIGILGLNPHNGMDFNHSEEIKLIYPLLKNNNIYGPLSPDSSFLVRENKKLDCLIGLYHDQVLTTFKFINKYSAINITLGLPFLRISPDHGTGKDIKKGKLINPESFLYALKFCEKYFKIL